MKKLFISMLAVAALASCSQEDVIVADKGELIGFNSFVENSTRAADPSLNTETFTSFQLWGTVDASNNTPVAIFANDTVSGTIGANSWSCTTKTQYWIKDAIYNFAGVKNGVVTAVNGLPNTITYTADGSTDLVYARSKQYKGLATGNPLVALEFKHLLSKVKFTLENTTSTATNAGVYTYTLTDVQIKDAITNGTYTVADIENEAANGDVTYTVAGSWAPTTVEAKDNMEFEHIEGVTNGTSKDSANEKLIIPVKDATVTYNVNIYYGGEIITTIPGSYPGAEFKSGYAYNLKLSTGLNNEIKFSVEETPTWTSNGDTTLTL
jgi:hypothetical protein